jgi:glycosyltransferase involved in cell wall biosynthesis
MSAAELVVVTPVYEDTEAAGMLFAEIAKHCGGSTLIVAVDDGSVANPLQPNAISDAGLAGIVLRLTRNVGHQRAIAVGLGHVADRMPDARRVVVMDCDGEDRPATIRLLLERLGDTTLNVVVAERRSRIETLRFKSFYLLYKLLFKLLTGRRISFGNYMAMDNRALHRMAAMGELGMHVAGTVLLSRMRWASCGIDRGRRYSGSSKMNFVSLALHGFRGLMIFAEDVLVRVGTACSLVAGMSVLGVTAAIILKSIGYATPGWFSVALGILVLVFLQTGAITLMTLMLTGVVRSSGVLPIDYRRLVGAELPTPGSNLES